MDVEAMEHLAQVVSHRALADEHLLRDHRDPVAAKQPGQHVPLLGVERTESGERAGSGIATMPPMTPLAWTSCAMRRRCRSRVAARPESLRGAYRGLPGEDETDGLRSRQAHQEALKVLRRSDRRGRAVGQGDPASSSANVASNENE